MPLLLAVALLSAAVIGYEILLMRLFSIALWHHFAYMIISLALLGFGASGTFIALARVWLTRNFDRVFAAGAVLFGISSVASFALAQRVPFNPLEVVWDGRQQLYLLQLYLLLAIPFFCAATCIGLSMATLSRRLHLIYLSDLVGAGAGALAIMLGLFVLSPALCLKLLGLVGFLAAALAGLERPRARPRWSSAGLLAAGLILAATWPEAWVEARMSPYKGLNQALHVPGAAVVTERSSPLGLLTVVDSPTIPFRHAPGLSLGAPSGPPDQLGIFTDGDSFTAISRYDGDRDSLASLDFQSTALPYHLLTRPRVLVLGAGGGADVLLALYHRARSIDAVELNPHMIELVRRDFGDFSGHVYQAPGVRVHAAEGRSFVAATGAAYDLIQVALLDSFNASAAGVYALDESNLYTVEALEAFLGRLAPGGYLAITRWLKVPPRDSLKLFATATAALERSGERTPGMRLALIRGWKTATLLVKKGALREADIAAIRAFSDVRSFDVVYLPGLSAADANRFNRLDEAYLFDGARALLGPDRAAFLENYKFAIAPATDDRPYFFHFFKWRVLPELLALRGRGGLPLVEWGYLILVATLVQAAVASVILIVLPLGALKGANAPSHRAAARGRVVAYFFSLGLAFLFIEIAFIQRFTLFLGHPLYAVAVVLAAFLIFAGLGSGTSAGFAERLAGRGGLPSAIVVATGGIVAIALAYLVVLPPVFDGLRARPDAVKIAAATLMIAPLAFLMGMPFPLGLRRLAASAPGWIPWAWGINGCASVVSAVLATVLAIHLGFTAVVALAAVLYGLAGSLAPPAERGAAP